MTKFNKASVAAIVGAIITIAGSLLPSVGQEVWQSVQTLLVTGGVWLIANEGDAT